MQRASAINDGCCRLDSTRLVWLDDVEGKGPTLQQGLLTDTNGGAAHQPQHIGQLMALDVFPCIEAVRGRTTLSSIVCI